MNTETILGILIPFAGTSLGAAMVFVLRKEISTNLQKILTGFAAGVMVAASFWSLLQPALESSEHMGTLAFLPAAVGFLIGVGFLLLLTKGKQWTCPSCGRPFSVHDRNCPHCGSKIKE